MQLGILTPEAEIKTTLNLKQQSQYDSQFHPVMVQDIEEEGGTKQGSNKYGNRYMRDFRKMVTTDNIHKASEQIKELPPNDSSGIKSANKVAHPKLSNKQINFGFNSFIGSGNTPQDLKV